MNLRELEKFSNYHLQFLSSEIIKNVAPEPCILFWISASIAEAAAVIPNGDKIIFAKGTAAFINGAANLLNNDPKSPLHWI